MLQEKTLRGGFDIFWKTQHKEPLSHYSKHHMEDSSDTKHAKALTMHLAPFPPPPPPKTPPWKKEGIQHNVWSVGERI